MITYDDFSKLDIRIGEICEAEYVPETDKLIKLSVNLGEETPRQIIAGIAEYVKDPHELVGLQIPVLANLEPRSIKGLLSEGMILAGSAELDHEEGEVSFSLLTTQTKLPHGAKVR